MRSSNAAGSAASTGSTSKNRPKTAFMARSDVAIPPLLRRKSRRLSPSRGARRPASARIRCSTSLLGGGLRVRRELFVGDEPGRQRHLGAQAPAHIGTDTEGVTIRHGHDRLLHLSRPRVALATALRSMLLLEAGGPAQTQAIHKVPGRRRGGAGAAGGREPGRCVQEMHPLLCHSDVEKQRSAKKLRLNWFRVFRSAEASRIGQDAHSIGLAAPINFEAESARMVKKLETGLATELTTSPFEFIPIKSSAATGSAAPGSCAEHNRVP